MAAVIESYLKEKAALIESALDGYLPKSGEEPAVVHKAMRYMALGVGKRFRPVLTLTSAEACGASTAAAILPACAIELIHTYSLIHDDLPALDNDDLRRGKASCHKQFGEAIALLAGDALLTLAFQLLSLTRSAEIGMRLIREISSAAGTAGMIGGQVMDIQAAERRLDLPGMEEMSCRKTGRLIEVSCLAGGIAAGANSEMEKHLLNYGQSLGFAFQIIDDIIDHDGYTHLMSASEIKVKMQSLIAAAKKEANAFQKKSGILCRLADYVLERQS